MAVGKRRRARRIGPAGAVLHPGSRRGAAALEDRAPSNARLARPGNRVLGLAAVAVPAAVGGARLPARDRRSGLASKVEPHRPGVLKLDRLVARRPAGGHRPACECPPRERMDAALPGRARRSVRAEIAHRRERRPRCVDSLRIPLAVRRSVPVECAAVRQSAAHRFVRNRPPRRTPPTAATTGGTRYAGDPRRSAVPDSSGSAW